MKKLFGSKKKKIISASEPEAGHAEDVVVTEPWTYGHNLKSRAQRAAAWGGLLALSLGCAVAVSTYNEATREDTVLEAPVVPVAEQSVGAVAQQFVTVWLAANRDSAKGLEAFVTINGQRLPQAGTESKNASVLAVQDLGNLVSQVWVSTTVKSEDKWEQRTFEVLLKSTESGKVSPLGFPRPIATPPVVRTDVKGYAVDASSRKELTGSVSGFLNAYLAGTGDLTRFVTPGTDISSVAPAPYKAVEVNSLLAAEEVPEEVTDGAQLHVRAEVQLSAEESFVISDYLMTLTARAGRWEISHLGMDSSLAQMQLVTANAATEKSAAAPEGK